MSDLISRQAALDAIEWKWAGKAAFDAIKELPSAQSEQLTGRWEYVDYGGFGNWHCTACRKICICNGDYDFCPNCGARMED